MIICPLEFNREDPDSPGYSLTEVDYYAWIPAGSDLPSHRLSLRKNLQTGEYEVYRRYAEPYLISRGPVTVISAKDTGQEEVAFHDKDLEKAVEFADGEWRKYHGEDKEPDQICRHKPPVMATFCPKGRFGGSGCISGMA